MVIPTNIEQINKGLSYLLPNKIFLAISVAIEIGYRAFHDSTFHMLDYVYLQTFKSIYIFK